MLLNGLRPGPPPQGIKEALGCKNKAVSARIDMDKVRHRDGTL